MNNVKASQETSKQFAFDGSKLTQRRFRPMIIKPNEVNEILAQLISVVVASRIWFSIRQALCPMGLWSEIA